MTVEEGMLVCVFVFGSRSDSSSPMAVGSVITCSGSEVVDCLR